MNVTICTEDSTQDFSLPEKKFYLGQAIVSEIPGRYDTDMSDQDLSRLLEHCKHDESLLINEN